MEALNAVGQIYRGFRITQYIPLEELQSTLIELVHESSGARVMHIANADPENLFTLSFQTLPDSSNGVAHILEHTVLCGSKKFPIKDPFFSMTRRSLNTYMNALTGQDFTCYPASSQVEKDFYNLLEVYIDAAFHPHLKKESFLQEGHRLSFAEPENPNSPLTIQGIVYNEMKGAMNSPDSRLAKILGALLTPDLTYAHNSGGEPAEIPHLTLEELIEFHQTFYHPSRCLFFFYGNLPLKKHLDFLLTHVLEHTNKLPSLPPLPKQTRFGAPVYAKGSYPITPQESPENKAIISISWLTAPISNQTDLLGLSIIASILMDTDASFLKKALLQSGLCARADSSLDLEMSEVPLTITCKGCSETQAKQIEALCLSTLEKFISEPISSTAVETALHQLEFERTEIGAEGIPFGLTLFFRAALGKQHGIPPENALAIHSLFKDLRNRLQDSSFLPSLVQKYLLSNPHYVVLTLKADPTLEKQEQQKEQEFLQNIQAQMTDEEKERIVKQTKELEHFQQEQENIPLDCLPTVTLDDVPPKPQHIPLHSQESSGLSIFHTDCFTNHILYADLLFDLPELQKEQLPLLSLYAHLFTEMGCAGRSYEENLKMIEANTGGASAHLSLYPTLANPELCKPSFGLRIKSLKKYTEPLFGLLKDFSKGIDLSDEKRLHEWLLQHAAELQHRFNKNAMHYATQLGFSGLSQNAFVNNEWHGLPYFEMVQSWTKKRDWIDALKTLQNTLLQGPAALILSCDASHKTLIEKANFYDLGKELTHSRAAHWKPWKSDYSIPPAISTAYPIASPVAFTTQTLLTCSYHEPDSPLLLLATELLDNVVLHTEIREKGGAYGSGSSYSPSTGNFYLYSYRDPHLSKTLKTFQKALEEIGAENFDEEDLRDAKLGVIQRLDTPIAPGNRALTAYSWYRSGITFEQRLAFRKAILETSSAEIAAAVRKRLVNKERVTTTFLGEDLLQREKEQIASYDLHVRERFL
ncbi:MAG: insulinase family protein [Chlamydiales bacterium]|nr:insulinase family protein [Chlamydiales bacterium]